MKGEVITVAGEAGTGKGTVCKMLAERLGSVELSLGSVYRYLSYMYRKQFGTRILDAKHEDIILSWLTDLQDQPLPKNIDLNNEALGLMASQMYKLTINIAPASIGYLQKAAAAEPNGAIIDGRDVGMNSFKDADHKFVLLADDDTRKFRKVMSSLRPEDGEQRYPALVDSSFADEVWASMVKREKGFANRSPMNKNSDVIVIDTAGLAAEEVYQLMLCHIMYGKGTPAMGRV